MRLSDEIVALDDERYKDRNVLAELKYCGREIKHRKTVTNDDLRFMAWLCRAAANLIKNKPHKYNDSEMALYLWMNDYMTDGEYRKLEARILEKAVK